MTYGRQCLLGAGIYLLALLLTAPATLIDALLEKKFPAYEKQGGLRLVAAQGTVWRGSGRLEVRNANHRAARLGDIAWRAAPAYLLRGEILYNIAWEKSAATFPVAIGFSHLNIRHAAVAVPATVLGIGLPTLAPLGLSGTLQLHIPQLTVTRSGTVGSASLQWLTAGSTMSPVAPLGDYQLDLTAEKTGNLPTMHATLTTLQGALQLQGQGMWQQGMAPTLDTTARLLPAAQQQLAPFLRMIAVERDDGSFHLQLQ
ncbi:MAG TPA: type II secretion system protein N [Pseudomonadales bacterium]|nr:type II secretion system protein N [Pseudomonadales bacterium]